MPQVTIKLQPEGKDEGETGRLAADLRRLIREEIPDARVTTERTDRDTQEIGTLLVVCLAHIAVTAVIEVAKTYWELHPGTYVKIQSADGTVLTFRGASREFEQTIKKLADAVTDKPS